MTLIRCDSQKPSCLSGVVWYARPSGIHHAKSALRAGASLLRCFPEPPRSCGEVPANAVTGGVDEAKGRLRLGDALIRRLEKPFPGLGVISRGAGALVKNMTKMGLSSGIEVARFV